MDLFIRQTTEADHEYLAEWFVDQPWNLPPVQNGLSRYGYIASDEHSDIACIFVYLTGTAFAHVEWVGMNPQREFEEHRDALEFLLERVEGLMKAIKTEPRVNCLVMYSRIGWLSDALKTKSWRATKNYTQLTKLIRHDAKDSSV